ncbi:hth-type transcriptional regulator [Pseudomonas aeruginosa]|nr:hth-type transcriptional regulator [Pseudomonas aeruginosa]
MQELVAAVRFAAVPAAYLGRQGRSRKGPAPTSQKNNQ